MTSLRQSKRYKPDSETIYVDAFERFNIQQRRCYYFVAKVHPSEGKDTDLCFCNRKRIDHDEKNEKETRHLKWSMEKNTIEEPSIDRGILFNGACYVRLALDTRPEIAEKILIDVWNIPKPRLIMSIIGGAKYFMLSDRLETDFINGIINVALKSDAWLVTNGFNVGIVQLVGTAIKQSKLTNPKKRITAIGITKWGSVKHRDRLKRINEYQEKKPNADAQEPTSHVHGERDLELNHSHYLMLDDGTIRNYETGDYRTRLTNQISISQSTNFLPVPVVTLVVEGGKDTITNMYYDLKKNIPVVIIDGSGRVADFFKRWLLYTKEFDNDAKDPEWEVIYEISELADITPPTKTSLAIDRAAHHGDRSEQLPKLTSLMNIDLTTQKKKLQTKFGDHIEQLTKDLEAILNRDEDESRTSFDNEKQAQEAKQRRHKKVDSVLNQVLFCLQPAIRSGISVYTLNSGSDLSDTIFRSICKSRQKYLDMIDNQRTDKFEREQQRSKPPYTTEMLTHQSSSRRNIKKIDQAGQRLQLLELAMNWDCIDVAKELIFKNSLDNILSKDQMFIYALKNDLPTFVHEFIKLGIDPSEALFPKNAFKDVESTYPRYTTFIKELYNDDDVNAKETTLQAFIESDKDVFVKSINGTETLNDLVRSIIGDYMQKLYFDTQQEEDHHRELWGEKKRSQKVTPIASVVESNARYQVSNDENKMMARDYAMRDLFIWAVFLNRIDMAKVLLAHMKYRICAALIATKILKAFGQKALYGDRKDGYKKSAAYFEEYAVECINSCEKNDPDLACEIVLQRIELFGGVTCLQVAAEAKDKLFIATPCCVQAMNNIWYDKLHPDQSRKRDEFSLFIGFMTLGLLAPAAATFRSSIENDIPRQPILEPYGIDYSDPYPLEYPRLTSYIGLNRYLYQLKNFHQVLRMKFCYHCIHYCFFLLLFSYVLLFNFQPPTNTIPSIHWTEILTIIFVSCMLIEELRAFLNQDSLTFAGKVARYFSQFFKQMSLVAYVLFYIGLILRFQYADSDDHFIAARVIMAYDLEIWWLRSISFIIVVPFLGPHLVAIGKMLKDLFFFMCIIALVMTAYGVASRSMSYYPYPNLNNFDTSFSGRSIFRQIVYPVYYLMYGSFNNETIYLDANPDAGWAISNHVLLAIHMLFVNILLINLLIAMFSKRYDEVHDDTQHIWHYQQYLFTREYYDRPPFFPPISLIYDAYHLIVMLIFWIRRHYLKKPSNPEVKVFKMIPKKKAIEKEWYEFEGASTYTYAHAEVKASKSDSSRTPDGQDSSASDTKADSDNIASNGNNSMNGLKQVQDDLIKINTSIDYIKEQLKFLDPSKKQSTTNN